MTIKGSARIGYGSGNPAGVPEFRPMNPWGRPMPAPERAPRPPLWQVHVKDAHDRKEKAVGPRMQKEFAEMFCLAISNQIHLGAERRWSEPHLVYIG
jgi:hypothetical protein